MDEHNAPGTDAAGSPVGNATTPETSHELRTPLNAILGFSQLVLTDERLDPGLREDVEQVIKAAQRLHELLNELLTPAEGVQRQAPQAPEELDAALAERVLYIEDNPANINLLERFFERRRGVELVTATRGEEGLVQARTHRPHVILLDLHLPDIPGAEVMRRLREDPVTRTIPVVVVSADAMSDSRRELLADGADAYLTKPLDLARLGEVLDGLQGGGRRGEA